jgi:hypothetical protein
MGAAFDLGEWSGVSKRELSGALAFRPKLNVLDNLVNKRGALECAKELLRLADADSSSIGC